MRSGRNWQPLVRSKAESVVGADIVADVVVEIGGLQSQAVIAGGDAVQRVVDAEFPGLAGLRLEVWIGQEREGDAGRMQAADQRLGDRRRAIAFGIGAVELQPFERALAERRDADGDARRQPVAGARRPSRRPARSCRSAVRRSPAAIPRSASPGRRRPTPCGRLMACRRRCRRTGSASRTSSFTQSPPKVSSCAAAPVSKRDVFQMSSP